MNADQAILDYRLSISDFVKQTFDCHLVPIADYQLWLTIGSSPITVTSVT